MPIVDPKLKIRTLLDSGWNPVNTQSQTPRIHTGWYNAAWQTQPQVTITNPRYTVIGGGTTGISAIDGVGGNVRIMQCDVHVDCWAHAEMKTSGGVRFKDTGINSKDLIYDMANEIKRLVQDNLLADPELEWMSWTGMVEIVETRIQPVVFRYSNSVRLVWKETF